MRVICSNGLVCDSNDYLSHHGILGQKWGKQNGPPYPLGTSDHSAAEKKAGWKKSLDNDGRTIDKKQAKKNYKNAKEEVSDANRKLKYAQANLKGNQLTLDMSRNKLKKLEFKARHSNGEGAYAEARKKVQRDFDNREDEWQAKYHKQFDDRVKTLAKNNPEISKIIEEYAGDPEVIAHKVYRLTKDKALGRIIDKAYDENDAIWSERARALNALPKNKKIAEERKLVSDFEKYVERSKLSVEYAKTIKDAAEKSLSVAKEELDIAKGKKIAETYSEKLAEQKFRDAEDHFKEVMSRKGPSDEDIRRAEQARDKARRDMESAWEKAHPDEATRNNDASYKRAKNNDQYEMEFLEAIQNKNYLSDNKNRRLAEYKEYLQDREKYWQNRTEYNSKDNVETMRKLNGLSESQRRQAESQARKQSVQNYTRVKSMRSSGMTYAQIAKKLGISESTVWAMIFDEE